MPQHAYIGAPGTVHHNEERGTIQARRTMVVTLPIMSIS
jgi:hypothetical protein